MALHLLPIKTFDIACLMLNHATILLNGLILSTHWRTEFLAWSFTGMQPKHLVFLSGVQKFNFPVWIKTEFNILSKGHLRFN